MALALASYLPALTRRAAALRRLDDMLFPAQKAFVHDPARYCAALCSRRAGKSSAAAAKLLRTAVAVPGSKALYVALTRGSAKAIMWPMLKRMAGPPRLEPSPTGELWNKGGADLGIGAEDFYEADLAVRLPNGSIIQLFGADADRRQREKILGLDWWEAVVDESASFRTDLRVLVRDYLRPATADHLGRISMIGTPGDFIGPPADRHLFYAVTTGDNGDRAPEEGWSVHTWNTLDNPHMASQWQSELASLPPSFRSSAEFRIMYLGQWAVDDTSRVYRYGPHNVSTSTPALAHYCIGVDLGWDDPTAFVVGGWHPSSSTLHVVRAHKQSHMTLDEVAATIAALRDAYPRARIIVDGANKQAVESIRARYRLPLEAADKTGKADFIRTLNTDLAMGRLTVGPDARPLLEEWDALAWDRHARVPTELHTCANHLADAALYMWRHARAYTATPAAPQRTAEEVMESIWERRAESDEDDDD
jgi:hypothetical protein